MTTNNPMSNKNDGKTWQELVKTSFGSEDGGYKNYMRRSLQAIVLYEAQRCCKDKLPALRPFQRKVALLDMAKALVDTLDFLNAEQQAQVLWRGGVNSAASPSGQAQELLMNEKNCWNRHKMILQELTKINKEMTVLLGEGGGRTLDEALKIYLQSKFDEVRSGAETDDNNNIKQQKKKGTTPPPNFFYNHNHVLPCYMLYYLNGGPNPNFPKPNPPKGILVAPKKPVKIVLNKQKQIRVVTGVAAAKYVGATKLGKKKKTDSVGNDKKANEEGSGECSDWFQCWDVVAGGEPTVATRKASTKASKKAPGTKALPEIGKTCGAGGKVFHQRRQMLILQNIKDHMELLKEFEGVVPQEELDERKRELYSRLTNMGNGGGGIKKNSAGVIA